jgi:signal transduction histidine kinase
MSPEPFLWSALGAALEQARIASRLSAARSTSDVASLVLGDVRAALGADAAVVAVRGHDARELTVAAEGVPAEVERALSSLSGAEPFPLVVAYRRGEPLYAETAADVADALPPLGGGAKALACLPLRTPGGTAGAVGFAFRAARRFGPADRAALDDLSRDVAAALERTRLRETERAARTRLEVLAEASALLLENAADLPALLAAVTRLVQQATGDSCFVQVLGEDGGLGSGPATVSHPDPEAQAALEAALRGRADAPARVAEVVLGRGETLHLPALGREPFDEVAGPHLRAFAGRFPIHGLLVTPLRTRGRPFGLVAVLRHRKGAPHTVHDRLLVEGVAARAGLAVAYARLNASHAAARARAERAARRTARLQVVTSRLAGAAGPREVAAVGAALAIEAAGGAAGGIALLRPGRADVELTWRRAAGAELAGAVVTRVLEGAGPAEACVRSGRPAFHADQPALLAAHPDLPPELAREPQGALATLPLRIHGEVAGALLVRFDAPRAFDAEERAFLENLADQCSQALARARLWQREHEWARRQSALADISRALSEAHGDVRRLLSAVALRVGSELDALCCVVLASGGPGRPELRAVHHPDVDLRGAVEAALERDGSAWPPIAAAAGPAGDAPSWRADPDGWPAGPALRELLEQHPPRGVTAAPLTIDGRVRGVLSVSRHGDSPELDGVDRWFVEEVAARTAVALAQTREREALADERQRLAEVLSRAEEAIRAKDEFLAMLSHELRNPLAPIVTALHLLRLRGEGGGAREREVIERQVAHLVRLVDDLLDVSRMTRGKVRLERRVVDAGEVITRAVEQASPLLEERRHALAVEVEPGLALHVDPSRVAQVVANLLTNAAKYTDPGGRITLRATRDGDMARVAVTDDGIGLSPALLPRIFDLFVQGERELDRAPGGLGIGLTIVRTMVELHGGRVHAESAGAGRGSTFTVWLPLAAAAQLAARPVLPAPGRARAGVRVLVVDDNEDAAELLAEALRERGHEPHVAFDGPSALALAARIHPKIGLLDLGLPVMDGYELARRLRALPGDEVALVAVTGYGQEVDRRASALAGFAEHLVKPVDLDRVCAAVDRLASAP